MDNIKEIGVTLNGKHSFHDYGLVMTSKKIDAPSPQKNYVSVPGRNGLIDMSEVLTGNVRYNNRNITMSFVSEKQPMEWSAYASELQNALQGQKVKVIFDDDLAFYWTGRAEVNFDTSSYYVSVDISVDAEPYKYSITTSAEDWLWDPFDFEQGIINELSGLTINGPTDVEIICSERWENPIVTSDSAMTASFEGQTFNISVGSQVLYEVILKRGSNHITFDGNGTISIVYVGGSL